MPVHYGYFKRRVFDPQLQLQIKIIVHLCATWTMGETLS